MMTRSRAGAQANGRSDAPITPDELALNDELLTLLLERTLTDGDVLGQLVLAGTRVMAQHMEPTRAGEAFLEVVRRTMAEMRH